MTFLLRRAAVFIALSLAAGAFASNHEEDVYDAQRVQSAPIVDGALDDPVWEEIPEQPLERDLDTGSPHIGGADFEASFKAVWRPGTLYIALAIQDNQRIGNDSSPLESDRIVIETPLPNGEIQTFTAPIPRADPIQDNPEGYFALWSADGTALEISIETNAMFADEPELRLNLFYIDVDPGEPTQRIGWVSRGPSGDRQYGALRFRSSAAVDSSLHTTWGGVKSLY